MTLNTYKFKLGYFSLGYFLCFLVWTATTYGSNICEEPRTVGLWETILLIGGTCGIFFLGQFWGERNTPADNKTV